MPPWMIYGANGYTGELIAREAVARGHRPILAGRSPQTAALAAELSLDHRLFPVEAPDLAGITLLLNCAGPFSATAAPLLRACLQTTAHYLDITGEIDALEHAHSLSEQARAVGIVICPGVGFDVVPTDCLARALAEALPGATHLALGIDTTSPISPGTARTAIEGMTHGGRIRSSGHIVRVPMGAQTRRIDFGRGPRTAMAFPWGDVSTATRTTGIGNVEVFLAVPPATPWAARLGNVIAPILAMPAIQTALKRRADRRPGPTAHSRAEHPSWVWGEARRDGLVRTARIRTANPYDVTVHAALAVVATLLAKRAEPGAHTPSMLCGVELVTGLPGSGPIRIA
jgi:short subunit dehydrogenase-like uncharacterized protein